MELLNNQLTYEMESNSIDLMKLSNLNKAAFSREHRINGQEIGLPNKSFYNSYKDYLNRKFGQQSEMSGRSRLGQRTAMSSRGGSPFGETELNRTTGNIQAIKIEGNEYYNDCNNSSNGLKYKADPYITTSQFKQSANSMGSNPFEQYNNGYEIDKQGNRRLRNMNHLDNASDLLYSNNYINDKSFMTGSNNNYGRTVDINNHNRNLLEKEAKEGKEGDFKLSNSACFKTINSLDQIKHLPYEEQIMLLFNENQDLKLKIEEVNNKYAILQSQYNDLKEKKGVEGIDSKNKLNDFLIQNNKELQQQNKDTESILGELIKFTNEINDAKNNNAELLDLEQIKNSPNKLKQMLDTIREEIFQENRLTNSNVKGDKNINSLKIGGDRKGKKVTGTGTGGSKSNHPPTDSNTSDSYYHYLGKADCLPCNIGIGNSLKGYSPRMCSPNRHKYIVESMENEQKDKRRKSLNTHSISNQ